MNTSPLQDALPFSLLVVGARPDALRALSDAAAELDIRMVSTDTEAAALDYAGANEVALVVIDLTQAPVDPAALGTRLRALQQTATPLVFLVDFETPRAQIDAAHALGVADFLSLPLIGTLVRARLDMAALHWQTVQLGDRVRGDQRRDWLQLVFANTTDYALIITDAAGIITQWEGVAEQVVGWTAAQVLGKSIALIFTPEDKAAGRPEIELGIALDKGRADDKRWHVRHDGSQFFADGVMVSLRDDDGTLRGRLITTLQDGDSYLDSVTDKRRTLYGILEYDLTPQTTLGLSALSERRNYVSSLHRPWQCSRRA